jgi:hypothetical protein
MEKVAQRGVSYFILLPKYYQIDQIKENEVHMARMREERNV